MDEDHTLKDEQDDQTLASETATSPTSNPFPKVKLKGKFGDKLLRNQSHKPKKD